MSKGSARGTILRRRYSLPIQALETMQPPMSIRIVAALCLAGMALAPGAEGRRMRDQDEAFARRQAGQILPLHQIESRIVARMQGCDYLGPEFDPNSAVYRLKFMRGGSVIYIDVDGRNGQVIGRSGY
jgi:hypothetical protein